MHAQVLEFEVFQKLEKPGSSNKVLQEKKFLSFVDRHHEIIHTYLLVFVERIDKNWATEVLADELLEDLLIKVWNRWARYQQIDPWVWQSLPQSLRGQGQLHIMDSVQELEVGNISSEDERWNVVQGSQHLLHFLHIILLRITNPISSYNVFKLLVPAAGCWCLHSSVFLHSGADLVE